MLSHISKQEAESTLVGTVDCCWFLLVKVANYGNRNSEQNGFALGDASDPLAPQKHVVDHFDALCSAI